jgi:hypothetical protein
LPQTLGQAESADAATDHQYADVRHVPEFQTCV